MAACRAGQRRIILASLAGLLLVLSTRLVPRVGTTTRVIRRQRQATQSLHFYSQKQQDEWVATSYNLWIEGRQTSEHVPFYLDLAANEPLHISNTAYFDALGWEGLCIEGSPSYLAKPRSSNRTCVVVNAIVDACANDTIEWLESGSGSGIVSADTDNKIKASQSQVSGVRTQTLEKILDAHSAPHVVGFLSLDVEGAEYRVLENFPFERYHFQFVVIERPPPWLNELLFRNHYIWIKNSNDGFDSFYVHESLGDVIKPVGGFEQVPQKCDGVPGTRCPWGKPPTRNICSREESNAYAPLLHGEARSAKASEKTFTSKISKVISLGTPRTGSTFQHVLLCLLVHLRTDNVTCSSWDSDVDMVSVVKSHGPRIAAPVPNDVLLFLAVRSTMTEWVNDTDLQRGVSYAQVYSSFSRCPLCEIEQYKGIFNLSTEEMLQVRQYMRYWIVLRQCCGFQQSLNKRQVLHGCGDKSFVTQGEIDHHDCFTKNLSAVEEYFTHTHLFERVNPNKLAPRTHLEYHWLTPGDCVRKDAEISSGLDFNRANRTSCTRD